MNEVLRTLFPETEPFDSGRLAVDPPHEIYYEQYGNRDGKPALFVHGGPGGGSSRIQSRFWDPRKYRVVLFDQRGCGKSTPHASLDNNTTWHLVTDMERLRRHLRIERWQVFGGSWGSTLALAYAQTHPGVVSELVLRGIFLLRKREIDWFYQEGASRLFPDAWESYVAPIPEAERSDLLHAYHRRLTSSNPEARLIAAKAWSLWEAVTSTLRPNTTMQSSMGRDDFALAFARIECHYFVNGAFLRSDTQLLDDVPRIAHLPGVIVQGRYDVVCPAMSAWALHRRWPGSRLVMVPDAGHSMKEPGILSALVQATDDFAAR